MMKNILIALACGAVLVFGYYFLLIILYQIYPINFDNLTILLLPLNLPYNIYKSIFGLYYGNPLVVKILNFAVAIILYSIPFYLVFTYFTKKKNAKSQRLEMPPNPPIFESSSNKEAL